MAEKHTAMITRERKYSRIKYPEKLPQVLFGNAAFSVITNWTGLADLVAT